MKTVNEKNEMSHDIESKKKVITHTFGRLDFCNLLMPVLPVITASGLVSFSEALP